MRRYFTSELVDFEFRTVESTPGCQIDVYKASDVQAWLEANLPDNWLDPLLTGEKAVIGQPPYTCKDIETVLLALKRRLLADLARDGEK